MKLKTKLLAVLGVLALGGYALGQAISVPQVAQIGNTDLIQVIPLGQPSAGNVYADPRLLTVKLGYYKSSPATGFTFTFANNQAVAAFSPSGTLAAGYVTFAPSPSDGAQECVFSTQTITAFYPQANTGQSINNATTTIAANTKQCWLYSASNATWDRD